MCRRLSSLLNPRRIYSSLYSYIAKDVDCKSGFDVLLRRAPARFIATSSLKQAARVDHNGTHQAQGRTQLERSNSKADPFQKLHSHFVPPPPEQLHKEADSIGSTLVGMFVALFGITFACVPLYEFFCQQSGYMGTTRRVKTYGPPPEDREGRMFEIDFITHSQLNWDFKPTQRNVVIAPGETTLAFYKARNLTDKPVIGVAAYHVIPDEAGIYFNKIQCFCFEEQMLNPGEEVDLPVLFFLDPEIIKDKRLFDVDKITLTYTFFEANSEIPPEYTTLFNKGAMETETPSGIETKQA